MGSCCYLLFGKELARDWPETLRMPRPATADVDQNRDAREAGTAHRCRFVARTLKVRADFSSAPCRSLPRLAFVVEAQEKGNAENRG